MRPDAFFKSGALTSAKGPGNEIRSCCQDNRGDRSRYPHKASRDSPGFLDRVFNVLRYLTQSFRFM